MRYEMGLYNKPFQSIQSEKKVYEVRLYDKKRQLIKDGDEIVFTNLTTAETMAVKVTEIKRYERFKEMYEQIDKKLLDCENDSLEEMLESTYKIYTKEQEEKWGTVAIGIEVMNEMIRNRGAAIIVQDGKIALIKRVREDEIYFVFPGGGIEEEETPEEATKREVYEELGVHIEVKRLITKVKYKGTEYYYDAYITDGVFGSGKGEEFKKKDRGSYIPLWMPINELENVNIKPYEVVESIFDHYKI